jgi:IS30 family transposase
MPCTQICEDKMIQVLNRALDILEFIAEKPDQRKRIGDWESDTMVGKS